MRQAGHLGVLVRKAHGCIDHDDAHIRTLNRHLRPDDAVLFNGIIHLVAAAQPGGINQNKAAVGIFHLCVDRIARRPRNVGDNAAVFPGNPVDQRTFAHIRLADDRHTDQLPVLFPFRLCGEILHHTVQQITGPVAVNGGNLDRVPQTKVIKLIEIRRRLAHRVALVDAENDRTAALEQHRRNVGVRRHQAGADVRHQYNHIGRIDGQLRLRTHLRKDHIAGARLNTAGIHQRKFAPFPLAVSIDPVARDARRIVHNRQALADQLIKQR